jgi:zinc protease
MMRAFVLCGVCLCWLVLQACSQTTVLANAPPVPGQLEAVDRSRLPEATQGADWLPRAFEVSTLANGMPLWSYCKAGTRLTSIQLVFHVGGGNDPTERPGLTDFTARLLDEGAGGRLPEQIYTALDALGTDYSVFVNEDVSVLRMHPQRENFSAAVRLLADIAQRPNLDETSFDYMRGQLASRALTREASPEYARDAAMRSALYGTWYVGHAPAATSAELGAIELSALKAHYRTHFTPRNATLVVAGDLDAEALGELERTFGTWVLPPTSPHRTVPDRRALPAAPSARVLVTDFPGKSETAVFVATRAPGAKDPDRVERDLFATVLGGMFNSRLVLNLRESKGYTYYPGAWFDGGAHAGWFTLGASVRADVTRESIDEMFAELRSICSDRPIGADELAEAQDYLAGGFALGFQSVRSISWLGVRLVMGGLPPDDYVTLPSRIRHATLDSVRRLASTYCDASRYVVVVAGDVARFGDRLRDLSPRQ